MTILIATKTLTYDTRRLRPGDEFVARSRRDARVLKAIGKAIDQPTAAPAPVEPVVDFSSVLSPPKNNEFFDATEGDDPTPSPPKRKYTKWARSQRSED